ncbi:LPXTG cell wall anchor domain-containing protein [Apilactobacillus kunkeei]|uniref:LPXTG cell wall anchor domain-containing protein n=1 Tax=Apilactobacillus kunkeei TaxID=148814 RepID=UPI00110D13A6|nr:LPXTG cell wall anchor domain-containing protein [Apilactobacillus kunkeei]TMT01486.1 LPXTG cell wall anchor domain-containing protein [Apilactobacillus kunkeei]
MKFNDKQSKLFKNAKKFVYVSAITGVLLTGTQVGQYASTYTAHADDTTTQDNNIATIFVDQFGNRIYGAYYQISKGETNVSSQRIADSLRSSGVDVSSMPATFDLTSQRTYKLPQPTHKLTVNLVDQNNKIVQTKTVDQVTNYGQTDLNDLITWAQSNKYGYNSFPSAVDNNETTVNISVIEPTTTVVNHTTQQQTSSTIETNTNTTQSDSNTKVQTGSNENEKSSTQSSASNHDEKNSSSDSESSNSVEKSGASTKQSSSASENVKSEADSSAVSSSASTSSESSAQSSTSTQSPKSDEKVIKSIDPVNKDAKKTGKQTSSANKKDVRAKLPQTGDKTNQSEESLLGVMTIALSAVLAFFGLRRKNK